MFKEQQNNRIDQFGGFIDDPNVGNEVIMDAINSDQMDSSNIGSMRNDS